MAGMKPLADHSTHWLVTVANLLTAPERAVIPLFWIGTPPFWSKYNSIVWDILYISCGHPPGHLIITENSPASPTPPTRPNQPFHSNLCYLAPSAHSGKPSPSWETRYVGKLMKQWKPSLQSPPGSTKPVNNSPNYTLSWRIRLAGLLTGSWYYNPM